MKKKVILFISNFLFGFLINQIGMIAFVIFFDIGIKGYDPDRVSFKPYALITLILIFIIWFLPNLGAVKRLKLSKKMWIPILIFLIIGGLSNFMFLKIFRS